MFLILTTSDLRLAYFDEAAGKLAEVAGIDPRSHYQHNFLFLVTCNPFPSLTPQSSDYSWHWEAAALSHASNLWAQAFSGMYSVFIALFISFILQRWVLLWCLSLDCAHHSAPYKEWFGFLLTSGLIWKITELKHGCIWETLFYDCLWKKIIPLHGAWRFCEMRRGWTQQLSHRTENAKGSFNGWS